MNLPAFLVPAADSWAAFYGDHRMVSVTVRFLHLAGIVVGGGTALTTDRFTLRALATGREVRARELDQLTAAHRTVVPALALVVLTGMAMALSDRETFYASSVYWWKMGAFALLLLNGVVLLAAERAHLGGRASGAAWLRGASVTSAFLWLAILFVGVWLTVAA